MLEACLMLVFSMHLLAVNVAMGGPLACLGLEWCAHRHRDAAAGRMARRLGRYSVVSLALGIALGGLLLALVWLAPRERYFAALGAIPPWRLWYALGELLFYFACLAGYVALLDRGRWIAVRAALALAAATNLMLHFPPLFAMISTIANRAELVGMTLDRTAYRRLLVDPEVISRVLHVWLASIAVTGTLVMGCASPMDRGQDRAGGADSRSATPLAAWGARWALVPTLLQLPVGLWVLFQLPAVVRESLLGGDLVSTALFVVSLVAALRLMHQLAAVALGDTGRKPVVGSLLSMLLVVMLMVASWTRAQGGLAAAGEILAR